MTYSDKVAVVLANSPQIEGADSLEVLQSINRVLNLLPDFEDIFIITSQDISTFYANSKFKLSREANLVTVPRTKGALATLCIGIDSISISKELFVIPINCQVKTAALQNFLENTSKSGAHVGVLTINSTDSIYSYARISQSGKLIEVIEKQVIGNMALSGIFYFKSTIEVLHCAAWAFKHNLITNGQFYIAPSLNYFVAVGKKILVSKLKSEDFNRI